MVLKESPEDCLRLDLNPQQDTKRTVLPVSAHWLSGLIILNLKLTTVTGYSTFQPQNRIKGLYNRMSWYSNQKVVFQLLKLSPNIPCDALRLLEVGCCTLMPLIKRASVGIATMRNDSSPEILHGGYVCFSFNLLKDS